MRRGQDDRLDVRIVQSLLQIGGQRYVMFAGKAAHRLGLDVNTAYDAEFVTRLETLDDMFAPPA